MTTVTVDPAALTRLAADLDRAARDLQRVRGRLAGLPDATSAAPELDAAVREFGRHWTWAIGRLHDRVATVGVGLRAAATAYADTDAAIASACD
jgi:uncharacterized protein YukE